jgi:hypothetical protein
MKKKLLFYLILLIGLNCYSQIISFPDPNFKNVLIGASASYIAKDISGNSIVIDANGNGEIEESEALNVYYLHIGAANINDATGLELQILKI